MKTYVLTTTDVKGGQRGQRVNNSFSSSWVNFEANVDDACAIGRKKVSSDQHKNLATYFVFDADELTALRSKTVVSIQLSITAVSGTIPAYGSGVFQVGYKYNTEEAEAYRNDAWARSNAESTVVDNLTIGNLWNTDGSEVVASNTPLVIDLTGSVIPKYGYVIGPRNADVNRDVTVSPSAILTVVTDEVSTYTVDYDANGGSGAPQSQTKEAGTPLTLSSIAPKRSGYKFDAWNTAADGTGVEYPKGSQYNFDAAVTLYAQWTLLSGSGVWVKGSDGEMHQGTVWVKGTDSAMHEASVYVKGTDSEMHQSS